jgi:hypothetical protein
MPRPSFPITFLLAMLWMLLTWVVGAPLPLMEGLDTSWAALLGDAFLQGRQFGSEVIFTFGPWGFLFEPIGDLRLFWWSLLGRSILGAGMAAGVALLATRYIPHTALAICWSLLVLSLSDPIIVLPVLCFLMIVTEDDHPVASSLVCVACGLAMLAKFTSSLLSIPLLLVLLLQSMSGQRRAVRILVMLISSFVAFWLLAGQQLNGISSWLSNSWQIASGYAGAIALEAPGRYPAMPPATLLCCLGPALFALRWWRQGGLPALVQLGWVSLFSFVAWKHIFIGYEPIHVHWGLLNSLLPSVMCLIVATSAPALSFAWQGNRSLQLSIVALLLSAFYVPMLWRADGGPVPLRTLRHWAWKLQKLPRLFATSTSGPGYAPSLLPAQVADAPTPGLAAVSTDIFPVNGTLLLTRGVPWHSRPVPQSYSAYTPTLLQQNAAFFRGAQAPEQVLLRMDTINRRYPTQDDSLAMLAIAERYEATQLSGSYVVFKRRKDSSASQLRLLRTLELQPGQTITVPETANGAVWVEIELQPSLAHRAISALFWPPILRIRTTTAQGQSDHRLIGGIGAGGFVLSPRFSSAAGFTLWQQGVDAPATLPRVLSLALHSPQFPSPGKASSFTLRLYELRLPNSSTTSLIDAPMLNMLQSGSLQALVADSELRASALQPESAALVTVPATATRFSIHAGMGNGEPRPFERPGACSDPSQFHATFRIQQRSGPRTTILWERTLTAAGDLKVELPLHAAAEPRELLLEQSFSTRGRCRPYWAAPAFAAIDREATTSPVASGAGASRRR